MRLEDKLWIGNSHDVEHGDLSSVDAILNVACDLRDTVWRDDGLEYVQIGLIDGPGNEMIVYHAAVLMLVALHRHGSVLVYCHTGSRAISVAIMYLELTYPSGTSAPHICGCGWDGWLERVHRILGDGMLALHDAHRIAFEGINWRLLEAGIQ